MAVTLKWRQHIEAWQRSGLSQAGYCDKQHITVRTFADRLTERLSQIIESRNGCLDTGAD